MIVPLTGEAMVSFATPLVIGQTSAPQAVTVTNGSMTAVTITSVSTTGDFAVTSNPCATLAPGQMCAPMVTFKPTGGGTRNGTLMITDTSPGSPHSVALTGTGQDFAVAPAAGSSSSASVSPGGTASYTLAFAPQGGLTGTVSLACSGAPVKATCTVNPASVILDGTNPANATVTVTTTASSMAAPQLRLSPPDFPAKRVLPLLLLFAAILILWAMDSRLRGNDNDGARVPSLESRVPVLLSRAPNPKSRIPAFFRLSFAALLLFALLSWASCGGGGTSSVPTNPGTPAGDYILTVTATNTSGGTTVTQTQTLNLHVN